MKIEMIKIIKLPAKSTLNFLMQHLKDLKCQNLSYTKLLYCKNKTPDDYYQSRACLEVIESHLGQVKVVLVHTQPEHVNQQSRPEKASQRDEELFDSGVIVNRLKELIMDRQK